MNYNSSSYYSLLELQRVCLEQSIPFAAYRLPSETEIVTLVQQHTAPQMLDSMDSLGQEPGFIVAPFAQSVKHGIYFLKAENIFYGNDIKPEFINGLSLNSFSGNVRTTTQADDFTTTSADDFIEQVNTAVKAMEDGEFQKVVLSKIRKESLPDGFRSGEFFLKLCERYPNAFISFVSIPGMGCWMGASPEPLLATEGESVQTVSLAGTQAVTDIDLNVPVWSSKEIEEQAIVTGFVEDALQTLGIREYSKSGPENFRAGNLLHLRTSFAFSKTELGNRLGDFLMALHPTPSVGGMPKQEARNFILANEKHDRGYYSGFLGPVGIQGDTSVFVNLRCLQLFDRQFVLYAGAGITAASVAKKEWDETENKMLTMMNVMRK